MLQRVGIGQVRFNVPGLTADPRGVVTGRQMVLRFSALERLISFLRLWSGEQSMDDFQPGLRLVQVRTAGGSREALVVVPVTSLPLIDAAARAARTAGGQCFIGAGKHFVQYRDSRAPLGYDSASLEVAEDATDFFLYSEDHTQAYAIVGDLPLDKLLLRLDLQRQHGNAPVRRDLLFLTVRRGLGALVIAYLHKAERRNPELRVAAALCDSPGAGAFQRGTAFWILRLENVPERLLGVLGRTPGFRLLAPVTDNVAIAVGYRHPVHLGSCKHVFPADRFFLFAPGAAGAIVINPAPVFSPIADLVRLQVPEPAQRMDLSPGETARGNSGAAEAAHPAGRLELVLPLRLEAAPAGMGRAVATLVPWNRVGWVRSLCYAIPASAVRGYRLALLERGVLVIAPDFLGAFPFGQLFYAPAAGLLVPLGWELRPAVSPEQLSARVGAVAGALVVFPGPDEAPFRIAADAIETLEARALGDPRLGDVRVEEAIPGGAPVEQVGDIQIENQPLGPMPMWRVGR